MTDKEKAKILKSTEKLWNEKKIDLKKKYTFLFCKRLMVLKNGLDELDKVLKTKESE